MSNNAKVYRLDTSCDSLSSISSVRVTKCSCTLGWKDEAEFGRDGVYRILSSWEWKGEVGLPQGRPSPRFVVVQLLDMILNETTILDIFQWNSWYAHTLFGVTKGCIWPLKSKMEFSQWLLFIVWSLMYYECHIYMKRHSRNPRYLLGRLLLGKEGVELVDLSRTTWPSSGSCWTPQQDQRRGSPTGRGKSSILCRGQKSYLGMVDFSLK